VDLRTDVRVVDLGNVLITNQDGYTQAFGKLSRILGPIIREGMIPIILGGDNSTSFITIKTFAECQASKVGVVWLDAHTDTADSYRGDKYWCGAPMTRILELPPSHVDPRNIAMVGVRGFDHGPNMVRHALEKGIRIYPAELVARRGVLSIAEEVLEIVQDGTQSFYVMFDPDVMDAVYVPGHAIPTTEGLSSGQAHQLIRLLALAGAGGIEFVEVVPGLDVRDMTVRLVSSLVLEFVSGVARRRMDGVNTTADAIRILDSYGEVRDRTRKRW
jgi:agmatinase